MQILSYFDSLSLSLFLLFIILIPESFHIKAFICNADG